uniref:Uncharacterized protein n=1 Tax=Fabrea salina TaxID=342563 RepID=A0A7S3MSH3_9CILI|mmetsp:Transcript_555/g.926  ORF Transcript_555/g.926 Transcript_555/m.926 type:complete len:604 (+) Transcript_555:96-1907(+)
MGNCKSKAKSKGKLAQPPSIPDFVFLYRQKKRILHFNKKSVEKYKILDNSDNIQSDSAVVQLSDKRFLIVGGTKKGELSKSAVLVESESLEVVPVAPLPIPAKEGFLLEYEGWVYYVGGTTFISLNNKLYEEGIPVMRFSPALNFWEVLIEDEGFISDERYFARHSETTFRMSKVLHCGAFMHFGKIFVLGGMYISSSRKVKPFSQVFCIDLRNNKQAFLQQVNFQLPFKVVRPMCGVCETKVVITGGVDPLINEPANITMLLTICESPKYKTLTSPKYELVSNYPPIKTGDLILFISFPFCAIFNFSTEEWNVIEIEKNTSPVRSLSEENHEEDKVSPFRVCSRQHTRTTANSSSEYSKQKPPQCRQVPAPSLPSQPKISSSLVFHGSLYNQAENLLKLIPDNSSQKCQKSEVSFEELSEPEIMSFNPSRVEDLYNSDYATEFSGSYGVALATAAKGTLSISSDSDSSTQEDPKNGFSELMQEKGLKLEATSQLVDLVCECLEVPGVPQELKQKKFDEMHVSNTVSVTQFQEILNWVLRRSNYDLKGVKHFCQRLAQDFEVEEPDLVSRMLRTAEINPEEEKVDKQRVIFAFSQGVKYLIYN